MNLDGGDGDDTLVVRAEPVIASSALSLKVAADGAITSNISALSNWDSFDLTLGKSNGNKVALGAGDDIVRSTGSRDTIDLGVGDDVWTGDYTARTDALGFSYYGAATGVVVNSAKANLATVKSAEAAYVYLGGGNDNVDFYDGAGAVNGGGGDNRLIVHPTASATPQATHLQANVGGAGLNGTIQEKVAPTPFHFESFRAATIGGGTGADSFTVDLSQQALLQGNLDFVLEGGGGTDDLTFDLRAEKAIDLQGTVDGIGFGTLTLYANGNGFDFRNIEILTVLAGAGDDQFDAGLAQTNVIVGGARTRSTSSS